ncbi:MAG: host attachment protein [Hyphomicrobiaceae bacterium]|nr:host attachment protein [Hyphomicrobiaceae bacterium]
MKLSAKMWVVLLDGAKGLVLANEGTALEPSLKVVRVREIGDNPPTHEQGRDKPSRVFDSSGARRSATEGTDLHQRAEDRFVAEFMGELAADATTGRFEKVVLAAPPVALGTARQHIVPDLQRRIVKEIAGDYVKMPVEQITKAITAALED